MCEICEEQFDIMSKLFEETFNLYLDEHRAGVTRNTPAKRVHDLAFENDRACLAGKIGRTTVSWFLAIALERLVALEASGVPT